MLQRRRATDDAPAFEPDDLYPDARPALERLRSRGVPVAIAGNFGRPVSDEVASWGLAADAVVSAEELGAEKPDPGFFSNLAERLAVRPEDLVYVGDRIDNDVLAARGAGCRSIFVRRGPWASLQERMLSHDAPVIESLLDVAGMLPELPTRK